MSTSAGILLADLQCSLPSTSSSQKFPPLPLFTLLLGALLSSYPEHEPENLLWSRVLQNMGNIIFPSNAELSRSWSSIGVILMILAILYLPGVKNVLGRPWMQWTGKVSFGVFLIHSMLARLVFGVGLYLGVEREEGEDWLERGNGSVLRVGIVTVVFFGVLYWCAGVWEREVEGRLVRGVRRVEERMMGSGGGGGGDGGAGEMREVERLVEVVGMEQV